MHTPVLLQEAVNGLKVKKNGLYIDATFGEGGHAREILKQGGKVLGIDLDINQIRNSIPIISGRNLKLVQGNFANIEEIAKENDFFRVDGILFDLGLSMNQIDSSGKGFSYRRINEPLDMRIDPNLEETAEDLVNSYSEDQLYEIFAKFSEELNSRAIAGAIVFTRRIKKIRKVGDLLTVIKKTVKINEEQASKRIFQALRIKVNNELENLKQGLKGSLKILQQEGRIVVISFHSLEDRIVKNFIRDNQLDQINKKVIIGDQNISFERSAKLRIISFK